MRTVGLVELPVFERLTPLVSGYLQAYALADPALRGEYRFSTYSASVKTPVDEIVRDVLAIEADVYGLSCYVWNAALMRRLVSALRMARPQARIMLGGPQVMHHAADYIPAGDEQVAVCNGEGEQTLAAYLRELTQPVPDLSKVDGISFVRAGELVTTAAQPRIQDLDTIPSPFLTGAISPHHSVGLLETNRGCPYHCGFCFWGAATNDRVYRFDEERVREEITWLSRNGCLFLYLADANWGMLGRDVGLTEHIAACAGEFGSPGVVYFSAAKNKPHAVTKITSILDGAGLIASQPISMQTVEPASLTIIKRSNIKLTAFSEVQETLRREKISSFTELIWPLPGETYPSFLQGIETLCGSGAQTIIVYSHLLLHNTPIYRSREELGLLTVPAADGVAEAEIVVATEQVSYEEFTHGMRFFYAMHLLHNTRALRNVLRYLAESGTAGYAAVFSAFSDHLARSSGNVVEEFIGDSIDNRRFYDIGNYGLVVHLALDQHREQFTRTLETFVREQPWYDDPAARALFELDQINLPYVYSSTGFDQLDRPFEAVRILERHARGYTVQLAAEWRDVMTRSLEVDPGPSEQLVFRVNHRRMQYPYMQQQTLDHNANYCYGMIEKVENIAPTWQAVEA